MKRWRLPTLMLLVLVAGSFAVIHMSSPPIPSTPGRPLAPCPDSPNCVCSEDPDPGHRVAPLAFTGSPAEAMARLRAVITALPRTRIVADQDGYLQAEFRTRILRFVDDVEFRMDAVNRVIQVRSASRVGYSDLGTNRRRVEQIRQAFEKKPD